MATTLVEVAGIGMREVRVGAGEGMSTRCQTPDVQVDAQRRSDVSRSLFGQVWARADLVPAADIHYVRKSNPCMQFANFRQTKPV